LEVKATIWPSAESEGMPLVLSATAPALDTLASVVAVIVCAALTVSLAALLNTAPAVLVATARYKRPLSAVAVAGVV